jgi:sulfite reductase (ferredoxin)
LEKSNVIAQNKGYYAIGCPLGDFYTDKARVLADLIKTMELMNCALKQNIVVRNIKEENLAFLRISQIRLCNFRL